MLHINGKAQYYFVELLYHVCAMSQTVKQISHYVSGWEENEKATETEGNVLFPTGWAFSKKGLRAKAQ